MKAFGIVTAPEEKLQILGCVLDVDEVVHEIPDGAGLHIRSARVTVNNSSHQLTGHVPPFMILSNVSASGIPEDAPERPDSMEASLLSSNSVLVSLCRNSSLSTYPGRR